MTSFRKTTTAILLISGFGLSAALACPDHLAENKAPAAKPAAAAKEVTQVSYPSPKTAAVEQAGAVAADSFSGLPGARSGLPALPPGAPGIGGYLPPSP